MTPAQFLIDTSALARLMRPGAQAWVPVHDRAFARAWEVQGELTSRGQHRSAGPVDLVLAATAELHGLALLHHDRDFDTIARVTGQPLRWYGSD